MALSHALAATFPTFACAVAGPYAYGLYFYGFRYAG
jgi:hypothetical protein